MKKLYSILKKNLINNYDKNALNMKKHVLSKKVSVGIRKHKRENQSFCNFCETYVNKEEIYDEHSRSHSKRVIKETKTFFILSSENLMWQMKR